MTKKTTSPISLTRYAWLSIAAAEEIENQVRAAIPGANIATHVEPAEDPVSMQDGIIT